MKGSAIMDLKKIISDILGKLKLDSGLLEKFKKNPIETIRSLLGGDVKLGDDDMKSVVDGVTAGLDLEGLGKKAGGFLAKLKSLFGGK